MTSDVENDEEGDDEDDPEYNFLADIDEPDSEGLPQRPGLFASPEVSGLMEELFKTFQDELLVQEQDEEGQEEEEEKEEEAPPQKAPNFNIPQTIRFEEPLADALTERHRTVKEQLAALRRRQALLESQAGGPVLMARPCALVLTQAQKRQLQQQIQQHVQLLTQVHMLTSPVEALQSEAITTTFFLSELESFAERGERARGDTETGFNSIFRACNLQGALSLLEEINLSPVPQTPTHCKLDRTAGGFSFPLLPPQLAWLLATRPVFMYPELLPHCSLDPALHPSRTNTFYTRGEDSLVVLGLRNFSGTLRPYELLCQYLLRAKALKQLRTHIHDMCHRRPDNIIKFYMQQNMVPPMPLACGKVKPSEQRPPVEREEMVMPLWLRKSVPHIHRAVIGYNQSLQEAPPPAAPATPSYTFPPNTRYPPTLPATLALYPSGFRWRRPASVLAACRVPPTVVINVAAPLAAAVIRPASSREGLAGLPGESQGAVALPYSPLTLLGKLGRPLLPDSLRPDPIEDGLPAPPESAAKTEPEPKLLSKAPRRPVPKNRKRKPKLGTRATDVANGAVLPRSSGDPQKPGALWDGGPSTEADGGSHAGTVVPKQGVLQNQPPSAPDGTVPAPAGSLKYVLVKSASQGAPQFFLVPQNCTIANGVLLSVAGEAQIQESSGGAPAREPPTSPKTGLGSPVGTVEPECAERVAGWEEEEEKEEKYAGDEEELEAGDFGGPLLALSESSGSPASSPCTLEKMEEEEDEEEVGWTGLFASTPQRSPHREQEAEGLDDITIEEVKSPVSEQSALSVPELQETMEKLSILASDGKDSLAILRIGRGHTRGWGQRKADPPNQLLGVEQLGLEGKELLNVEAAAPRASISHCGRQEPDDRDASKPLLVDDNSLSNDPLRESKDMAFAQAYLRRVCAAVRDVPGKVEEFLRVLHEFEQGGEGRSSVELFGKLQLVLRDWPNLLWDFAAFLRPEQAQECGLLAEQQAFERSRHFLRQLEMSFGESPSHYQQVVRALRPGLSPAGLKELKAQMASLLKHHTHLQGEFWEFFDELHTPSVSDQPEDTPPSEVGEGTTEQGTWRGARRWLKKSKLPASQEREEPLKVGPMAVRRRKNRTCKDSVSRATRRRGLFPPKSSTPPPAVRPQKRPEEKEEERGDGGSEENVPRPAEQSEEEEEEEEGDRRQESRKVGGDGEEYSDTPAAQRTPPSPDPPVCAKNVSHTSSGLRVILWTREADRLILTTCQQKGANQRTFQAVSAQLGNKTANEVSLRFRELMHLFRSAARPHDVAGNTHQLSGSEEDPG
ncbi:hypothetical protein SKAU_G00407870 [Synaphobranchus kaupii]|uniref:GON-4-like protein n=1 Tax=Synaphobranchus kaupii TaxID=118154 RepID=A0A9Q1EAB6_SYNKA|nr:hypothetical protein SKAU_G00407870 [Synaphobranchus kaupii]